MPGHVCKAGNRTPRIIIIIIINGRRTWTVSDAERLGLRRQTEVADVTAERALVNHGVIELILSTELTEHSTAAATHHQRYHHESRDKTMTQQTGAVQLQDKDEHLRTISVSCNARVNGNWT